MSSREWKARTVADRILEAAAEKGLKDSALGRLLGGAVPYQLVRNWRIGAKKPSAMNVRRAAELVANCTFEELVRGAEDENRYLPTTSAVDETRRVEPVEELEPTALLEIIEQRRLTSDQMGALRAHLNTIRHSRGLTRADVERYLDELERGSKLEITRVRPSTEAQDARARNVAKDVRRLSPRTKRKD